METVPMAKNHKLKIYLDNCCYNRPYDDQNDMRIFLETQAKLYIQSLIVDGVFSLTISYMSIKENSDNPNEAHSIAISDFFHNAVDYVDYDKADAIEARAAQLMTWHIKHKDALHLACAEAAKCDF
jgi:tRNA(Ile)-lysidine synthase TilS/MesJ